MVTGKVNPGMSVASHACLYPIRPDCCQRQWWYRRRLFGTAQRRSRAIRALCLGLVNEAIGRLLRGAVLPVKLQCWRRTPVVMLLPQLDAMVCWVLIPRLQWVPCPSPEGPGCLQHAHILHLPCTSYREHMHARIRLAAWQVTAACPGTRNTIRMLVVTAGLTSSRLNTAATTAAAAVAATTEVEGENGGDAAAVAAGGCRQVTVVLMRLTCTHACNHVENWPACDMQG